MKYFDENNFQKFKEDKKEYMSAYYLHYWITEQRKVKDINVFLSERLIDGKELIALFKENAEFKIVKDPSGEVFHQWVVNERFAKECEENLKQCNKKGNGYEKLKVRQEEIQNQIYEQIRYEKMQGKRLEETSAVELLEKLDHVTFYETNETGFRKLRLKIASLADTKEELSNFHDKIRLEDKEWKIRYFSSLVLTSVMTEECMSDNNIYNMFNQEFKSSFADHFFENMNIRKQIDSLAIKFPLNAKETPDLLVDLNKDERIKNVDILLHSPSLVNEYVYFQCAVNYIAGYLKEDPARLFDEKEIERSMIPLVSMIRAGCLDISSRKNNLGSDLANNLEGSIKRIAPTNYHDVLNKIEDVLEQETINREKVIKENTLTIIEKSVQDLNFGRSIPQEIKEKIVWNFVDLNNDEKIKLFELTKDDNKKELNNRSALLIELNKSPTFLNEFNKYQEDLKIDEVKIETPKNKTRLKM